MPPAIALGVGGLATLGGSIISSNAAGNAADKQAGAAAYSADLQKQMFEEQRSDMQPWRTGGLSAMYGPGGLFTPVGGGPGGVPMSPDQQKAAFIQDRMKAYSNMKGTADEPAWMKQSGYNPDTLKYEASTDWDSWGKNSAPYQSANQYQLDPSLTKSFSLQDFQADPGYQFRMQQGQDALERSAAARGGLNSGATLKAITEYGQNFASNEFGNAYNRFTNNQTNRFNRLAAIAGIGQTAQGQMNQAAQTYGTNMGNIAVGNANAQGASAIAQGNAWSGGLQGLAGLGQNWMNYSQQSQFQNDYLGLMKTMAQR